jgi:hypothetical protein
LRSNGIKETVSLIEDILNNSRQISTSFDQSYHIIRHGEHFLLFWPNNGAPVIKLFYKRERIYNFNSQFYTFNNEGEVGFQLVDKIVAALPRIRALHMTDMSAASLREFFKDNQTMMWARLHTSFHGFKRK